MSSGPRRLPVPVIASPAAGEAEAAEGGRVAQTPAHPPQRPGNPAQQTAAPPYLTDTEAIPAMTGPLTRHRDLEPLKIAARSPGADRNATVVLAARLAAARADAEGYRYFSGLAAQSGEALPLALAGF